LALTRAFEKSAPRTPSLRNFGKSSDQPTRPKNNYALDKPPLPGQFTAFWGEIAKASPSKKAAISQSTMPGKADVDEGAGFDASHPDYSGLCLCRTLHRPRISADLWIVSMPRIGQIGTVVIVNHWNFD
jgi:hypothetical protein